RSRPARPRRPPPPRLLAWSVMGRRDWVGTDDDKDGTAAPESRPVDEPAKAVLFCTAFEPFRDTSEASETSDKPDADEPADATEQPRGRGGLIAGRVLVALLSVIALAITGLAWAGF